MEPSIKTRFDSVCIPVSADSLNPVLRYLAFKFTLNKHYVFSKKGLPGEWPIGLSKMTMVGSCLGRGVCSGFACTPTVHSNNFGSEKLYPCDPKTLECGQHYNSRTTTVTAPIGNPLRSLSRRLSIPLFKNFLYYPCVPEKTTHSKIHPRKEEASDHFPVDHSLMFRIQMENGI